MTFAHRDEVAPAHQGRRLSRAGVILAFLVALACAVEDGRGREPEASGAQVSETHAKSPVASLAQPLAAEPMTLAPAVPAREASEPDAPVPEPSLEDLLRLPASVGQMDPVTGRPTWRPGAIESDGKSEDPQPLQLELGTRTDPAVLRPSTSRTRTDAGVSVDVGETIKLRGGVRLEQESGQEPEEPVPTVGIEKRF